MTSSSCAIVTRGTPITSKSMSKPRPRPSVKRPSVSRCIVVAERRGHEQVARVVVRRRGRDAERRADGAGRAAQRARVLGVEPLRDEDRAEPDLLGPRDLGHEVPRRRRVPGQPVEPQLVQLLHPTPSVAAHPTHRRFRCEFGRPGARTRTETRSARGGRNRGVQGIADSGRDPAGWAHAAERRVVVLAYDGIQSLDVVGPVEVFDVATRHGITPPYRIEVVGPDRRARSSRTSGITITPARAHRRRPRPGRHVRRRRAASGIDDRARGPGAGRRGPPRRRRGRAGSRRSAPARSCSPRPACSTAAASPRTGRRCRRLARRYPDGRRSTRDPIFVRDGDVYTSAGVTAGIDLCLALVEEDHGRDRRAGGRPPARRVPQAAGRAGAVQQPPLDPDSPTATRSPTSRPGSPTTSTTTCRSPRARRRAPR